MGLRVFIGLDYSLAKFGWGVVVWGEEQDVQTLIVPELGDFAGVSYSNRELAKSLRITDLLSFARKILDYAEALVEQGTAESVMVAIEDFAYGRTEYVSYDLALAQGALRHYLNERRLPYVLVSPSKVKNFQANALPSWVVSKADEWRARDPKKDVLDGLTLGLLGVELRKAQLGLPAHRTVTNKSQAKGGLSGLLYRRHDLWITHGKD